MIFLPLTNHLIGNILQLAEHKICYCTDPNSYIIVLMMMCSLCQHGPFLLAQSHIRSYCIWYVIVDVEYIQRKSIPYGSKFCKKV